MFNLEGSLRRQEGRTFRLTVAQLTSPVAMENGRRRQVKDGAGSCSPFSDCRRLRNFDRVDVDPEATTLLGGVLSVQAASLR